MVIVPFGCDTGKDMEKLYFTSPQKSISQISKLLREEDLLTLRSYFNLENTDIPIDDFQNPPINKNNINIIIEEYKKSSKPVLVHCGAGEDRTGSAVHNIMENS